MERSSIATCTSRPTAARTERPTTSGTQMPSTLSRSTTAEHVVIDESPTLRDAMRVILECRTDDRPVPDHLLVSMRTFRLHTLADAIDGYNARRAS
jgi:hypothetical protein